MKRPNLNLQTIVLASVLVLSTALLFGLISDNLFGYYQLQVATGAQGSNAVKPTATTTTNGTTIQLTAKEVSNGVYRWIDTNNGAANPKLKVFENANNIIKIQNPTDTKHQLIIDTGADELPASGVVAANGNGQLSFNPNQLGTFTYHCAFHPFMMQGTIQIVKP
ncbi:MAG TPA: cupredoxin domain-containing protein [Nitrososphaeraceae archaeon]|nr:cupredoxin domain-containing protein [Nitrososphaeraceae archaeon]